MTVAAISEKGKSVLNAVKTIETPTVPAIAKFLGMTVPAISATIAPLKKNDSIVIEEGVLKLTAKGEEQLAGSSAEEKLNAAAPAAKAQPSQAVSRTEAEITEGKTEASPRGPAASKGDSKAAKAQIIFDANPGMKRADLMQLMKDQVGLSTHGANTYIYNMRKKAGLVKSRTAVVAESTVTTVLETEVTETPVQDAVAEETSETPVANLETVADMPAPIEQIEQTPVEQPETVAEAEPIQILDIATVAEAWKAEDEKTDVKVEEDKPAEE